MAPANPKSPGKDPALAGGDPLLQDLNLSDIEGLEGAIPADGKPLPKKVELDIEDMLLEEEEPPAHEVRPERVPEALKEIVLETEKEPAEKKPKTKLSVFKLAIIGATVLIPIVVVVSLLLFTPIAKPKPKPTPPKSVSGPADAELKPFIVNFSHPQTTKELIMYFKLEVLFSSAEGRHEFQAQNVMFRDLIFRFIQGHGPVPTNNPAARTEFSRTLIELINANLKRGRVEQVQILEMGAV